MAKEKSKRKLKKYEVTLYFSGFCTQKVMAENEDVAFEKARLMPINKGEILSSLEPWDEVDQTEEIND